MELYPFHKKRYLALNHRAICALKLHFSVCSKHRSWESGIRSFIWPRLTERSGANGQRKPASNLVQNGLRETPILMLKITLLETRFGRLFGGVFWRLFACFARRSFRRKSALETRVTPSAGAPCRTLSPAARARHPPAGTPLPHDRHTPSTAAGQPLFG